MMTLNVGNIDRVVRIAAGATLIGLSAFGKIGWWGYLGIIPLITGAIATCPLYSLLGFRTTSR